MQVTGKFTVKLSPLAMTGTDGVAPADSAKMGRLSIDKRFHGELDAESRGEMLSARSATAGSAGYVAMEKVSGTLVGRHGTFVLQHSGTMGAGQQSLNVAVVPDSGSDQLTGLAGTMMIRIEGGQHYYDFTFTLPGLG